MKQNLMTRLGVAASSAGLVLGSLIAPALAVDIEVSGNGADSNNTVNYSQNSSVNVTQNNSANISNNIEVDAQTGNNEANKNTGGDVKIDTGDADATVNVTNVANSNTAKIDACCPGDIEVKITGNGYKSDNDVTVDSDNRVNVDQDNDADIDNYVDVWVDTGHNEANKNTGGDVSVETGDADASVTVENKANANVAVVSGDEEGGEFSVVISGNGADSDNNVDLDLNSEVTVDQYNDADISNDIEADAETGDNEANKNTGGDVKIDTGDADTTVDVSNMANLNWADVDACGCILDGSIKVSGNGADSDNDVTLDLDSRLNVDQDNNFDCEEPKEYSGEYDNDACNDIEANSDTGDNESKKNTSHDGDPSIETGDASSKVDVDNQANVNKVGDVDLEGSDVNIEINLEGLLALLLGLLD
jgi:hypothetical protein